MYNIRTMNENILPTMTDEERNEFLEILNYAITEDDCDSEQAPHHPKFLR